MITHLIREHIDLLAGLAALAWAVLALFAVQLQELCDYRIAASFALGAFGRWYGRQVMHRNAAMKESQDD